MSFISFGRAWSFTFLLALFLALLVLVTCTLARITDPTCILCTRALSRDIPSTQPEFLYTHDYSKTLNVARICINEIEPQKSVLQRRFSSDWDRALCGRISTTRASFSRPYEYASEPRRAPRVRGFIFSFSPRKISRRDYFRCSGSTGRYIKKHHTRQLSIPTNYPCGNRLGNPVILFFPSSRIRN